MNEFVMIGKDDLRDIVRDAVTQAAKEFAKLVAPSTELWNSKQVAEYLQVSAYTVANVYSHRKDFPKAVEMSAGSKVRRRWNAADVKEWKGLAK